MDPAKKSSTYGRVQEQATNTSKGNLHCLTNLVIITTRKGKKHLDPNKNNDLPFEEEQIERDPARVLGFDP
jgi:hypothetical protein